VPRRKGYWWMCIHRSHAALCLEKFPCPSPQYFSSHVPFVIAAKAHSICRPQIEIEATEAFGPNCWCCASENWNSFGFHDMCSIGIEQLHAMASEEPQLGQKCSESRILNSHTRPPHNAICTPMVQECVCKLNDGCLEFCKREHLCRDSHITTKPTHSYNSAHHTYIYIEHARSSTATAKLAANRITPARWTIDLPSSIHRPQSSQKN